MNALFRLPGAASHDPNVEHWLNRQPDDLHSIARHWFARMRACGDDVRELMHDGCPVACVGDAAFGYVNVFTAHVNVGFYNGAVLDDPAGLLEGSGKRMRHVKLRPHAQPNTSALEALIVASYMDVKARVNGHNAATAMSP